MRKALTIGFMVTMLALVGCTMLPKQQAVSLFQLPETALAPSDTGAFSWSLRLRTPRTNEALAGTRLLVMTADNELAAYRGARWVSTTPRLWQDHLMRAMLADGRMRTVTTDRDNLMADRELSGVLRAFHVDVRAPVPEAVIRYDVVLASNTSRRIMASQSFIAREPAQGKDAAAMVTALGVAADRLAEDLLNWLLSVDPTP